MAKTIMQTFDDMAAGRRNPRVLVVEVKRFVADSCRSIAARWETGLTSYDPVRENGRVVKAEWRPKRPDELPENQPESWDHLIAHARNLQTVGATLEAFARVQRQLAEARIKEGAQT